jgi:hypothetical protein
MVDTKKQRTDFSSDPEGKVSMMGHELRYAYYDSTSIFRPLFDIVSACQDVCLNLKQFKRPVYWPYQLMGFGKPISFDLNHVKYVFTKLNRKHVRTYKRVIWEFITGRYKLLNHPRIVKNEIHFRDENRIVTAVIPKNHFVNEIEAIESRFIDPIPPILIQKLVDSGNLYTENELIKFILYEQRLYEATGKKPIVKEEFIESVSEQYVSEELEDDQLDEFLSIWLNTPYVFNLFQRKTKYYFKDSLNQLLRWNPLRVDSVEIHTNKRYERPLDASERDLMRLFDWFVNEYKDYLSNPNKMVNLDRVPRDVISDDEIIIAQLKDRCFGKQQTLLFAIVTNDKKMIRKIEKSIFNICLIMISTDEWEASGYDDYEWSCATTYRIEEIIIDQGAMNASLYSAPENEIRWRPDVFTKHITADMFDKVTKGPKSGPWGLEGYDVTSENLAKRGFPTSHMNDISLRRLHKVSRK